MARVRDVKYHFSSWQGGMVCWTAQSCDKQSSSTDSLHRGAASSGRASGRYRSTDCVAAAKDRHRQRRWIHAKSVTFETGNFRPFHARVLDFVQTRLPPTMAEVS